MQNRKSNKTKTNCGIGKKRRIYFWKCGDCSSDSLSLASAIFASELQQKKLRDGRERERERRSEKELVFLQQQTRGHQQRAKGRTLGWLLSWRSLIARSREGTWASPRSFTNTWLVAIMPGVTNPWISAVQMIEVFFLSFVLFLT
jgi:hypothetical protein